MVLNIDDGSVAIQQVWLFDDFFSTSVIEDASLDPGGTSAGIQKEIDLITEALKPYNYCTEIEMGDKPNAYASFHETFCEQSSERSQIRCS